ncbi:MAG: aspartate-semialdehyde dehydrogenase [Planctomycetes bacterium]|nr:aspartate-semialdehyde dehydrogenase [Planctomycetota bacterium]
MPARPPILAIVGATGTVGREMLDILASRDHPAGAVRLFASKRSAGSTIAYCDESLTVNELTAGALEGVDIALFSAGSEVSRRFAPPAAASGVVVIDNSSAFRMEPEVPLVIPEVNGGILERGDGSGGCIIANPNCSTIILLMALTPIQRAFGIKRIIVSTYQAASGAGAAAMRELSDQSADVLAGRDARPVVFHEPCAFNVFSHNTKVDPATGRNVEEQKMIDETRKIWRDEQVAISTTCIRVPVLRAHAESINVELHRAASEARFRAALTDFPGLTIVDDRGSNDFPTSLKAAGGDDVLVGRIRPDASLPREDRGGETAHFGFDLFAAGDQLRKGAALNAIQIMDLVRQRVTSAV